MLLGINFLFVNLVIRSKGRLMTKVLLFVGLNCHNLEFTSKLYFRTLISKILQDHFDLLTNSNSLNK